MYSWATIRIARRLQRLSTVKDIYTQEILGG